MDIVVDIFSPGDNTFGFLFLSRFSDKVLDFKKERINNDNDKTKKTRWLGVTFVLMIVLFGQGMALASDSTFLLKWGAMGSGDGEFNGPNGVAVDSLDNVYVADTSNHRIQKFDSDGNFLTKWGTLDNTDGQFNSPGSPAQGPARRGGSGPGQGGTGPR